MLAIDLPPQPHFMSTVSHPLPHTLCIDTSSTNSVAGDHVACCEYTHFDPPPLPPILGERRSE